MSRPRPARTLFLKWLLLNALSATFLTVLGITLGGRLHGAPLYSIPIILVILAYANVSGGRICWLAEGVVPGSEDARVLLHQAEWLRHWAWNAQTVGILSAVLGFYVLLTGEGSTQDLHDRILQGGIVFTGTFVGVFASQVLEHTRRMIEHALSQ